MRDLLESRELPHFLLTDCTDISFKHLIFFFFLICYILAESSMMKASMFVL
jgi:hypothetical protein